MADSDVSLRRIHPHIENHKKFLLGFDYPRLISLSFSEGHALKILYGIPGAVVEGDNPGRHKFNRPGAQMPGRGSRGMGVER